LIAANALQHDSYDLDRLTPRPSGLARRCFDSLRDDIARRIRDDDCQQKARATYDRARKE